VKILVADDDPGSNLVLRSLLTRWGYQVTAVADGDAAWRVLTSEDSPRLVVLDWKMPGREGPAICADLRRSERPGYFYVILLTALDQRSDLVTGMEAGADDYIVKPFEAEELRVRLRAGQRILDLEAELTASREAFREQATHDSLTGLLSRGAILGMLERELARGRRDGTPLAVALADIDRFKLVNDGYGHQAGDAVLVQVAHRMKSQLRESDAVGRVGGEEFLAVLPGATGAAAVAIAERFRTRVSSSPIQTVTEGLTITVSIGVAVTQGGTVTTDVLISKADKALYLAKEDGRNRVRYLEPDPE
jgi:two-component system, cell cycle response regulator